MSPKPAAGTRTRLLDAAEEIIYTQGFAATSIDQILQKIGMTKGTFFYHFKTKNALARALIERFAEADGQILKSSLERAEKLSDDPLQQLLILVGLMLEVAEELDRTPNPGCLIATYCYEAGLFDDETRQVGTDALMEWRIVLEKKLRAAAERYPPKIDIDYADVADMLTALIEGAFVMARTLPGHTFAGQVRQYRNYLQLLFGSV